MIKLECIQIADSAPAPLLALIVGPSEKSREVGEKKKDLAERYIIRHRFWTELLTKAKETPKREANQEAEQVRVFSWPTEACQSVGMES